MPVEEPRELIEIPNEFNETMLECADIETEEFNKIENNVCTTEAAPIPASPSLTDTAKRKRTEDDHETSFEHPAKKIREEARLGIEKQASRMIERSKRKLKALSPGDNVAIPVPLVDRSKLDSPNVIGVILSTDKYGYVVGTKS